MNEIDENGNDIVHPYSCGQQNCAKHNIHICAGVELRSWQGKSQPTKRVCTTEPALCVSNVCATKALENKTDRISCFVDREWVTIRVALSREELNVPAWGFFSLLIFLFYHHQNIICRHFSCALRISGSCANFSNAFFSRFNTIHTNCDWFFLGNQQ